MREGEKRCWLSVAHPQLGTWSTAQACVLTGNRNGDLLIQRLAHNSLSHNSQGYLYMLKVQLPLKYSSFDVIYLSRCFLHCSKQFLNSSISIFFSASAVFCFISSTLAKYFPLRTLFSYRGRKNNHQGQDWVNRVVVAQVSSCFWSKTAEHSAQYKQVHS